MPIARSAPESFAPLVKRVLPAVVNIAVTETVSGGDVLGELPPELRDTPLGREFRRRFGNRREQTMGAGSGFIIDPSGLIVTNNHVVGHADKIVVSLTDGTRLPARVIGTDELTDVALIKVQASGPLPAVAFGDSRQVEVGDWVLAAGNPFGLGGSVTAGIISARGRDLGAGPFDNFLQLDAPINPGNSGGPIFNMDGQVIAISTAIVSPSGGSVGIGFATPSELRHADRQPAARQRPYRARLARRVGGGLAEGGVTVASVERTSPAARAGHPAGRYDPGGERRAHRDLARPDPRGRRGVARHQREPVDPSAGPRDGRTGHGRPPAQRRAPAEGARSMRILVVEDDKDVGGLRRARPEGGGPRRGARRQRPRRPVPGRERGVRRGDPGPHAARRHRRHATAGDAARRRRTPCRC